MGESATVTESAPAVRVTPEYRGRFNIRELLELYDSGKALLRKPDLERWRDTFALGVNFGGVYRGMQGGILGLLAVFWRTDNPHVRPRAGIPEVSPAGNYVYICWLWNAFGLEGMRRFRNHLREIGQGARYLAHHDQRKGKGGGLVVRPLRAVSPPVDQDFVASVLAQRNGHGQ